MTIMGAISHIDSIKPNRYTQVEKIRWLSTLDGLVKREIIDTHEGGENVSFKGYDEMTALTTELLIPSPYDEVYFRWLEAQIDYIQGYYFSKPLPEEEFVSFIKEHNTKATG